MGMKRGASGGGMSSSSYTISSLVTVWLLSVGMIVAQTNSPPQTNDTNFIPATNLWINCGATTNASIPTIGLFSPDTTSFISEGILAENTDLSNNDTNPYPDLLNSARIFEGQSTYKLPVVPGNVWVRLWFYPFIYQSYTPANGLFSVIANEFTLLTNLTLLTDGFLFKEYLINAKTDVLSLTFIPAAADKFAYINGLAVVSAPNGLLSSDVDLVPRTPLHFNMQNNSVETMYRVNVGGSSVSPVEDSFLTREWESDTIYLFGGVQGIPTVPVSPNLIMYTTDVPRWTAPAYVYATARVLGSSSGANTLANITWVVNIDPGYAYYVRLHFAETVLAAVGQRVFNVFLNNKTAFAFFDVVDKAGGNADTAVYLDYVVPMFDLTYDSLWVQIGTAKDVGQYTDCILNGIEIFKVNNTDSSFAGTAIHMPVI